MLRQLVNRASIFRNNLVKSFATSSTSSDAHQTLVEKSMDEIYNETDLNQEKKLHGLKDVP